SLEKDQYDHITATYYLLAERRLKRQLTMMATAISDNGPPQAPQHVLRRVASAGPGQLNLEPLALSPRIQESHVTQADMFKSAQLVDSLVSPITAHAPSPLTFTSTAGPGERRKFSLIREESGEEESETEMSEKLAMGGAEPMDVDFDKNYEVKMTKSLDEVSSDSDSRSGSETSLSRKALALRRPVTSRPTLRSVSSSPQLLNQIFEEGESDGDDDLIQPSDSSRPRVYNTQHHHPLASPELLRKLGRMKKRRGSGQRGTSCSSSDASDTDDPDSKKRKEKLKHRFPRKDSSDTSSDTDGPGGFGGGPGGHGSASGPGGKGGGNPRRDRRDSDRKGGKDKGGGSSSSSKGSKNSKSGSKRAEHGPATLTDIPEQPKQAAQGKPSVSDAGKQQQAAGGTKNNHNLDNILEQSGADSGQSLPVKAAANGAHHIRKSSNLSLASNISNLSLSSSLTSRSSKYVVDSNAGTPRTSRDEDDKGHKINARIIHVISREFSDIYERLSREGSLKEDNGSICSNDCSLRNNSQVKRRSKEKVKVDINSNGLRDKMVLNAGTTESKGGISVKKPVTKCCVLF
ncbi:SNF-related serine/threonine-protein kinase-like, partial [Lingula anatina]|uniref:SNF-related serine/threonine-protein kinase-like n=1 Tax=Lingula anatina TaxID=7574 RepID=A0A1S3IZT8_LINAN